MNILVICSDYPDNNGNRAMAYVHTRNLLYMSRGSVVQVINFASKNNYRIDGIDVVNELWLNAEKCQFFDLIICHAPNLRQHYRLLKRYDKYFKKLVFFFHGHEVLKISKVYPKPFDYIPSNPIRVLCQDCYDEIKFLIWRWYFQKVAAKSSFVFVSYWMKNEFFKWVKVPEKLLVDRSYVTYNCIGKIFEEESYDNEREKEYDFITIRGNIDNSKYGVDIVNRLAQCNPSLKFLLIGKGNYFDYNVKASNIKWEPKLLAHNEIPSYLNKAKVALMPTRTDAQGVMMCEMASFGMPVITSDIPVCHEVFDGFEGVAYIDNNKRSIDLTKLLDQLNGRGTRNTRYFNSKVGNQEYDLLETINHSIV